MLSVKECTKLVAKEYPSFYVSGFFEYQGEYYFTIVPKGMSAWKAITDLHKVDRNTGYVTGAIQYLVEENTTLRQQCENYLAAIRLITQR